MGAVIFRWGSIVAIVVAIFGALVFAAQEDAENKQCGEFDTVQLGIDIRSGYFEAAGMEMAKAVITDLALQLECERDIKNSGSSKDARYE